jgi:steroid 5-alpha reductase family enzyme
MDTSLLFKTILVALAACCIIMMLVWVWANRIKNAGVVDIFWSFNFLVIAAVIYFMTDGFEQRRMLACGLAALWSLRLGIYLLIRVGSHLNEEEGRYKQLRKEWAPNPDRKFFVFFQAQAVSNIFLAAPFFIVAMNKEPKLSLLEMIGAGMWLVSIIGEGVSDWQLKAFKNDPSNKGKVCQYGLWNYSRHPNYFFQLMIWISVLIFSVSSPYGWIAVICPLTIGYLIFKVTGIPMTEEQAVRSKGEAYKEYQRTTSAFVPWFKVEH